MNFDSVLLGVNIYRTGSNCLLNTPADIAMNITEHPGQRYSVDKQCQIIYGPESFYCAVSSLLLSIGCMLYLTTHRIM